MTTYVIFTDGGGCVSMQDNVYADARAGTGAPSVGVGDTMVFGQQFSGGLYQVEQGFGKYEFGNLSIGTILSATITVSLGGFSEDDVWSVDARETSWSGALTSTDFVPGASLGAATRLASLHCFDMDPFTDNEMDSEPALVSYLNGIRATTGVAQIVFASENQLSNAPPTGFDNATSGDSFLTIVDNVSTFVPKAMFF